MTMTARAGQEKLHIAGAMKSKYAAILTPEVMAFLAGLSQRFSAPCDRHAFTWTKFLLELCKMMQKFSRCHFLTHVRHHVKRRAFCQFKPTQRSPPGWGTWEKGHSPQGFRFANMAWNFAGT